MEINEFLNPYHRFRGNFTPENLVLDANLQEFQNKVSLIVNLEIGGKLEPQEAYKQIKRLWKQLKASKKNLIDKEPTE